MIGKLFYSTISFKETQFFGNQAVYGGAIYLSVGNSLLDIWEAHFVNNSALNGGAIYTAKLGFKYLKIPFEHL